MKQRQLFKFGRTAYLFFGLAILACGKPVESPTAGTNALLVFYSNDVSASRTTVLNVAQKQGRLLSSSATSGVETEFKARIAVHENKFFETMKDLGPTGRLVSEHTETLPRVETTDKTGVAPAEKEKTDRDFVIEIRVTGPGSQDGLKIPAFREALYGVANAVLSLLYFGIWLSPLILIYVVYRLRRARRLRKVATMHPQKV